MNRWLIFIRERFSPLTYLPMVIVFLAAHYALIDQTHLKIEITFAAPILLAIGVVAFFLKLRLYDEIKDYEVDLEIHPHRPLQRGLITGSALKRGILLCVGTELVCFGLLGFRPLVGIIIAIAYSLLMYKEFFVRERIRARLTTYAVTHTAVSVLLSLAIYSAISSHFIWQLNSAAYYFALSNWCLFNIFEFGRKTFSLQEEKMSVDSYSKLFGRFGAVSLVIIMAILSLALLSFTPFAQAASFWPFIISASATLGVLGVAYAVYDKLWQAKIYRIASSAYLVVIYGGLIISSLRIR